jgi:uncharacterized protein YjbJ (UPF0337 family)
MDEDTLKGKGKDAIGRAKRQVGEWTDDPDLQSEGAAEQIEGKVQKGIGKIKESARDAEARLKVEREKRRQQEMDKNRKTA